MYRKQTSNQLSVTSDQKVQSSWSLTTGYWSLVTALGLLLTAYCLLPTGVGAQGAAKFKLNQVTTNEWPDVSLNLTLVGADGKAVPNVNASQFEVREQGQPQALTGLELGPARSVPLALVLAMDTSGSMNANNKMEQSKASANTFLNSLQPNDSATLLAFNDQVRTIVPATGDKGALQAGVNSLQAGGNTAIYDALYRSSELLTAVPAGKRRAVILLTDGTDTSSKYGLRVASDVAKQSGTLVYAIGLGPDTNDTVLQQLSEPTGGKYYKAPAASDLDGIYQAIAIELDSQLYLKYHSNSTIERSYQIVIVEIKYTSADGQVFLQTISYRPHGAAVATQEPSTVSGAINGLTVTGPVPLPEGLIPVSGGSVIPASIPTWVYVFSLVAAALAGIAAMTTMLGMAVLVTPSATSLRMQEYVTGSESADKSDRGAPGFWRRVVVPAFETAGQRLFRLTPKGYTDHIENLLTLTGPPYRMRVWGFLGLQLGVSAITILLLLAWALSTSPDAPTQWALAVVLGAAIGVYVPYFLLKRRVTLRQKALFRALPGALDFLAINVEAGLGFDAAMSQVVQRWHNSLTDELALLLIDFQIGKPRKDAWRDLIQRTQVPELTSFVTAMLQNEQVGSSIGTLLRTQADQMRIRRRQAAEESARTAPVKMLLPMVFFIFPGLFVVILGPAVPQVLDSLTNLGK